MQRPETAQLWMYRMVTALSTVVVLACERSAPATARKDTPVAQVPPRESTVVARPETVTWDSAAGPALFVAGTNPQQALVVAPRYTDTTALDSVRLDTAALQTLSIDLLGVGKRVGTARIVGASASGARTDSCRSWPTAHLAVTPADSMLSGSWSVAFEAGRATAPAIDSIEGLPSADSARLAADVARLASALPGDTAAAFRGLPFVVTKAWRSRIPQGPVLLIAVVVRNVNQEANPRQERILLVAERDTLGASTAYTARYTERITGREETLETTDPIALVLLGTDRRPTLVVSRDAGMGFSYALIERTAGQWHQRWASTYAGC